MTPLVEAVGASFADRLLQFNIRSVEQFLVMAQDLGRARKLALALNLPLEEMQVITKKVLAMYPDLELPARPEKTYGMGYGKREDWERLSKSR